MNVKNTLLLFITISLFTIFLYYIKKEIGSIKPTPIIYDIKSDSLNKLIDSLNEELFKKDVIIGKYDIALDILKESEPEAANTFEISLKTKLNSCEKEYSLHEKIWYKRFKFGLKK